VVNLNIVEIFRSGVQVYSETIQGGPKITEILLPILFYGFGIFVAHRYSTLGLRSVYVIFFQDFKQLKISIFSLPG
jgi:hypothetical protein